MIEHTLTGAAPPGEPSRWPSVPARAQRRWQARWRRPAQVLAHVLAACGHAPWAVLAAGLAPAATCADLVAAYAGAQATPAGQRLAAVAALLDRLAPRMRLM